MIRGVSACQICDLTVSWLSERTVDCYVTVL